MGERAYLDHSATSPPSQTVVRSMVEAMTDEFGNPSSLHGLGWQASRRLQEARETVAGVLGVAPDHIIFTSGGSEANNLALRGLWGHYGQKRSRIITAATEHSSVLETAQALKASGASVSVLDVDREGRLDLSQLEGRLDDGTLLVSLMHVNNETGTIHPIEEVGRLMRRFRRPGGGPPFFHVDAVQSFARYPLLAGEWGVDMISLSGHKLGGPKGVGALCVARGVQLVPLITGGEQERGLRAGTENVPGISGMARAVTEVWDRSLELRSQWRDLERLLVGELEGKVEPFHVNGPRPGSDESAPHIINLSFPGVPGEVLVRSLDSKGIQISTGSACHSRSAAPSHVLRAMGLEGGRLEGAVRVSLGPETREHHIRLLVGALKECVGELRSLQGGSGR